MRHANRLTTMAGKMTKKGILAAAVVSLALAAGPVQAAIQCSIGSVSAVAFPDYDVFRGVPTDAQGSVTYSCLGVGQNTVTIDLTAGRAGQFNPRQMRSPSAALPYNLFLDAGRGTIWGDGGGGTARYGPFQPPNNSPVVVPIFGRIPQGQNAAPGTYTDSVMLTLNF
jgi:spore coat protein U-like protein